MQETRLFLPWAEALVLMKVDDDRIEEKALKSSSSTNSFFTSGLESNTIAFSLVGMATTDKYDRQLRLWGAHGQRALMEANLLLLGAGAVGTETVKNLVLPGIGKITVCDDQNVTEADQGNNFFVTQQDLGRPKAQVVTTWLCEMNTDVAAGEALIINPTALVLNNPEALLPYNFIIAANQPHSTVLVLSQFCWERNIPLLVVRSVGFLGYLRLQIRNHEVIEGKPDPSNGIIHDVRVGHPFPALEAFARDVDLARMDPYQHKHVPFIVILVKVLQDWKLSHDGSIPVKTDRAALVAAITALSDDYYPQNPFSDTDSQVEFEKFRGIRYEENFQEALKNVAKLWTPKAISSDLSALIEQEAKSTGEDSKSEFSALLKGLKKFMSANDRQVPHKGEIPDMVSTTAFFVELQKIYEEKALQDKNQLRGYANECRASQGLAPVNEQVLGIFCKNVFDVTKCVRRSICDESVSPNVEEMRCALWDLAVPQEQTPILWHLTLQAANEFHQENGRYPGQIASNDSNDLQPDIDRVWEIMKNMAAKLEMTEELITAGLLLPAHAQEIVRYGAIEMHNISAIVGGISAQEVVKVVTHQYVPIDNTYIYNGIACVGSKHTF